MTIRRKPETDCPRCGLTKLASGLGTDWDEESSVCYCVDCAPVIIRELTDAAMEASSILVKSITRKQTTIRRKV